MKIQQSLSVVITIITIFISNKFVDAQTQPNQACDSLVYCIGGENTLLHAVQMNRIFPDSKTFVDMSMKKDPAEVLKEFEDLADKTDLEQLRAFVNETFELGSEFENWSPDDYTANPAFLSSINDLELRNWASTLNSFWGELGRKVKADVKDHPDRYSMIYVDHGVIVPGGRFKEFYYWDSYWIQIGLLHSEMYNTTKGMLKNFLDMVETYGFVPNGGRIYFMRSQPPLLIPMVKNYVDATQDIQFLKDNIATLDKEFNFWMTERNVTVYKGDKEYTMVRYNSEKDAPRPESYKEDFELAEHLMEDEKNQLYHDLHSGAESGWDFSSRWWIKEKDDQGELKHTRTTDIAPADLNGFIYLNAKTMAEFHRKLNETNKAATYDNIANEFKEAIEEVLWNEEKGSWFDYEITSETQRIAFYQSNIIPLWAGVNDGKFSKVLEYLKNSKSLEFPGGVPTSLQQTGEQWDFPNGWAPLEHFFVDTLSKFKDGEEIAFQLAEKWLIGNYKAYLKAEKMFEKYDVTYQGLPGGGGEYEVVVGFGWTNGVVLDFLARYGSRLKAPGVSGAIQLSPLTSTTIALGSISIMLSSFWG